MHPRTGIQRLRASSVRTAVGDLGGAAIPAAQQLGVPEAKHQLSTPRGRRRSPSGNGANRNRAASRAFCASTPYYQGDQGGTQRALSLINAIDEVTQWEIVAATRQISELWLDPGAGIDPPAVPFRGACGFHTDNGSEFINYRVAGLLEKLFIEQTKSRAYRCGDNGLVEAKNGAVVRKHIRVRLHRCETRRGCRSIPPGAPQPLRELPPAVGGTQDSDRGQRQAYRRVYLRWATPFELFLGIRLAARTTCGHTSSWRNWIASPRVKPIPSLLWRCSAPNASSFRVSKDASHDPVASAPPVGR